MTQFDRSRNFLFVSIFILGLWSLVPTISQAQSVFEEIGRLPMSIYTTEEYGGNPTVWASIQGDAGLMYYGTGVGMHEYDGVSWRSIFKKNEVAPIRNFAKDSKGRIFYSGFDFGFLETDAEGNTQAVSLSHVLPEELKSKLLIPNIFFLNGYLIIRNQNHLIKMEFEEDMNLKSLDSWQAETRFGGSFVVNEELFIRQIDRGLFKLKDGELNIIPGTEIFGIEPVVLMLPFLGDNKQSILIGAANSGFYLLSKEGLKKYSTEIDPLVKEGNQLYSAIPYQGNYILGMFGGGIFTMNPKGEILKKIGIEQGLHSDVITSVYLDQNSGLWATTEDGMMRISIDSPILNFGKDLGINSAVRSIQKAGDEFFLGTNTGLVKFDPKDKVFRSINENSNLEITDLVAAGKQLIIPGTQLQVLEDGKLVGLENIKDGGISRFVLIPKNHPNLLFVGTTTGIFVYEKGLSKEFPWEYLGKVPGVGPAQTYLFETKDGTIITGNRESYYAIRVDKRVLDYEDTNRFKTTVIEAGLNDTFSVVEGEFYVFSNGKMKKYSSSEGQFMPTEEFNYLENDLNDFLQDKSGILWYESMSGKKHILKRDSSGKFVKNDQPNSLSPYLSQVDFKDEDSIMWFGSPKGLIRYDPKKDNSASNVFFTLIRRIETKTDTLPLPEYGRNKDFPAVERKDNSYRFEFAAPYFEEEKKTKYQTYLEGFDLEWVDWNDNRFKEYTNLPAGTYTFRVRAMAFTGRISEEASYSFVVLPPWYAAWWAYLIYALLIGSVITAIVKWRSRQLQFENRLLEERVNERTAELEKSITDLKSTQAQLIQSEKMASLGELTAGIAHEIQNPLNFVNNFSELSAELVDEMGEEIEKGDLEEVKAIASDLKDNLKKINHHGRRAGSIVKGMLAHSRKSSFEKEETDINALADECLRLSFHGLRAKDKSFSADFKTDFDPTIPKINVVSQDIGRVILNLINNAFYAVREKAKSASSDFKPEVIVQTRQEDNNIIVSVSDNGQGIPESIQEKILQPFFTTKPAGEGTGLGLSLSYDIIKAHGGELKLESEEGKETTFSIVLPMHS